MPAAQLFLIPNLISEGANGFVHQPYYQAYLREVDIFFVENLKPARQHIKRLYPDAVIDNYEWVQINKNESDVKQSVGKVFEAALKAGKRIGLVSDSGCPCVADPGGALVLMAHHAGAKIIPLVGASSLLLALMSSGSPLQQFAFNGYLPIEQKLCVQRIQFFEHVAKKAQSAQIFIETPYRILRLFGYFLSTCSDHAFLSVAQDITGKKEYIQTMTIRDWKSQKESLLQDKIPTIFTLFFAP